MTIYSINPMAYAYDLRKPQRVAGFHVTQLTSIFNSCFSIWNDIFISY